MNWLNVHSFARHQSWACGLISVYSQAAMSTKVPFCIVVGLRSSQLDCIWLHLCLSSNSLGCIQSDTVNRADVSDLTQHTAVQSRTHHEVNVFGDKNWALVEYLWVRMNDQVVSRLLLDDVAPQLYQQHHWASLLANSLCHLSPNWIQLDRCNRRLGPYLFSAQSKRSFVDETIKVSTSVWLSDPSQHKYENIQSCSCRTHSRWYIERMSLGCRGIPLYICNIWFWTQNEHTRKVLEPNVTT